MLSPSLFGFLSIINAQGTKNFRGKGPLMSISMDYRYPFAWARVTNFVLSEKRKGPPDDSVQLTVEGLTFHYAVSMPWYSRILTGRTVLWDDVLTIDNDKQEMVEIGCNVNLREKGTVTDTSRWYAAPGQPEETLYTKTQASIYTCIFCTCLDLCGSHFVNARAEDADRLMHIIVQLTASVYYLFRTH
eukprot:16453-Heterococcus_DN1.PRE.3